MEIHDHPKVLVIDDDESIRASIVGYLEDRMFTVFEAINGQKGLENIRNNNPDLILCDLRMPEMDGLEVLRRIQESGNDTPVIVVSGTGEISDTVQALRLGAADFITKPIRDMDILFHAVDKTLEKKQLLDEQERYKRDLETTNTELRETIHRYEITRDNLIETRKMAALGDLVAGIAHEINTPVGTALTASSFLEDTTREIRKSHPDSADTDISNYIETVRTISESLVASMNKAASLVNTFKQIAVDHHFENIRHFDLRQYTSEIILGLEKQYPGTVIKTSFPQDPPILMDSYPGALSVILNNLMENSITHGFNHDVSGTITISAVKNEENVEMTYQDNGRGMAEEVRTKVFDPFFTTRRSAGPGLGLSIVYNMVTQKLKGSIDLESRPDNGVKFIINVPAIINK